MKSAIFLLASATLIAAIGTLAPSLNAADTRAEQLGPRSFKIQCGDVLIRIDGPKKWTLSRIEYKKTLLATEESAYGTVFQFPGIGLFGTGHILDVNDGAEDVEKLEFTVDGEPTNPAIEQMEGEKFRLHKVSRIRNFQLDSIIELHDNRLSEQVVIHTSKQIPLDLVYNFMHAWSPTATAFMSGKKGQPEIMGDLKDTNDVSGVQYINKLMDWVAVYDGPSRKGAVSYVLQAPETGTTTMFIKNCPKIYRKFYLMSFASQIVPADFTGTYKMVTAFFESEPNKWHDTARTLAHELSDKEANKPDNFRENARRYSTYIIPSWGDLAVAYPETDPGMSTPEAVEKMIKHWKGRGYTGVFMRTDLAQFDPNAFRRNQISQTSVPYLVAMWRGIDQIQNQFNYYTVANQCARSQGFEFWAWHPHLFSDGAPEYAGSPGPGRLWPWSYVMNYTFDHPESISSDRTGKQRLWMIREYVYPQARSTKIAEFVYMARKFGIKRFIADFRSEASQVQDVPDKPDRMGFNQPVAEDMKAIFGVDILKDPRFDVDSPDFNTLDPMVENWHKLRGTYMTQFFRELRESLREIDPAIKIAVTLSGERIGPPMGNWILDWRTWVDEGLIDQIINPVDFDACHNCPKDHLRGCLTDVSAGRGMVSFKKLHEYIAASRHPEINVISTAGPAYFVVQPPQGADGWRITDWYDSYTLAWYQRWQQWKKDIDEFGCIKFIEQNFDSFKPYDIAYAGAAGDMRYQPVLRACPGCWYTLGDGNDAKPVIQNQIKHGPRGNAVRLTQRNDPDSKLVCWHMSFPDRSNMTAGVDTAVTNGTARMEFWLYRPTKDSGLEVCFKDKAHELNDVCFKISSESGRVVCRQRDKWISANYTVPVGSWQQFMIELDLETGCFLVRSGQKQICRPLPYGASDSASQRYFNELIFRPQGPRGSILYLDDISVHWMPMLRFQKPLPNVMLSDDFESYADAALVTGLGPQWSCNTTDPNGYFIENGTSFGPGVKSLRITGTDPVLLSGSNLICPGDRTLSVDCDIFVRSDRNFPYMTPIDYRVRSKHDVLVNLKAADSNCVLAGIKAADGIWQFWDGTGFVKSSILIDYDVWNHVQVTLAGNRARLVVQPLGQMPHPPFELSLHLANSGKVPICLQIINSIPQTTELPSNSGAVLAGGEVVQQTPKNFTCLDNVLITCNSDNSVASR